MNFKAYLADESGAVTVDWVVLTAALVGLGFAVILVSLGGINEATNGMSAQIAAIDATELYGQIDQPDTND